ncbi:Tat binding protein 1-interacting [Dipodascopsis uninucleata]
MGAKKENGTNQSKPTADEAEERVLEYMIAQNRPYSATDIVQNLHNTISRPAVNRALANLETRGELESKTFGKQVIYVARQARSILTDGEDENNKIEQSQLISDEDLDKQLTELKAEDQALSRRLTDLKNELTEIKKSKSTTELEQYNSELKEEVI